MISKFPLLKLPLLGIEAVVMNLEISNLIHLSLSTKRLNRLIKSLRLKMNKFRYVVRCNFTSILFNFKSPNQRGSWIFDHENNPKGSHVTASIGELELRTTLKDDKIYSDTTGNIQENVKVQMDYLKELIRFPVPDAQIQTDDLPDWKRPLFIGFSECQDLSIMGKNELKEETLHEILQTCSVTDSIYMSVPMSSTFTYDLFQWKLPKAIHIKKSAHWVTADMLFRFKCSHMTFNECQLTAQDFLQFVERWLNSDDTDFQYLHLKWKGRIPRDLNLVNLDVELKEFDPERRNGYFPYTKYHSINVSAGQDFYRKDGVLASILLTRWSAILCVFHERFPNLDGKKRMRP
ncbi:unnamed protein product [Caenorhabditis brenneri]